MLNVTNTMNYIREVKDKHIPSGSGQVMGVVWPYTSTQGIYIISVNYR